VKHWLPSCSTAVLAALIGLAPLLRPATAQENAVEPVAVVAIASVDEVLGDIAWLTESAGQGDFGKMVALLSGGYTVGMDKKRPLGLIVTIENDEAKALGFLPVRNLDALLAGLEDQVGKPEDAGDGILEVGGARGNPVYVKEVEGWAYVAQTANALANLPPIDPAAVVGDLTQDYTMAVRVNVGNIPAEMKKVAVAQMKMQVERQLAEQAEEQSEQERELSERSTRAMLKQVTSMIEETDQFTLGFEIDAQAGQTYLDTVVTAREGTSLAEQWAQLADLKSSHAGFLAPGAAVNLHAVSQLTEEQITFYQDMAKSARENALQEIENDEDIETEEARQLARDVINALFDVGEKTIAAGKIDGGASLFLTPEGKLNFVAGGTVQDAAQLDETFKKLVEASKNEPKAPQVKFNAAKHGNIQFHTMKLAIPEKEDARDLFGENLDVAVGFGPRSLYFAVGPAGLEEAQKIIDASQAKESEAVPPAQFVVAVGPILRFASAVKEDPLTTMLAATLRENQDNDHISLRSQAIERGVRYRLEVEKGVLELIGAAARMMQGGGQPPARF
jgi:hypothetical protein